MSRFILVDLLLFLLPFAFYAVYLFVIERNPFHLSSWNRKQVAVLAATGLLLVGVLVGLVGENAGRQLVGRNVPAEAASKQP